MKIIIYSITFLIVLFCSLYQGNTTITTVPFSIKMERPAALVYVPIAVLIWFVVQRVYWTGFNQGHKEGLKECEEINKIGREAEGK